MAIDEQKLSYLHLLLDEPIYVVKETAVQIPEQSNETGLAAAEKVPVAAPIQKVAAGPSQSQPVPPAKKAEPKNKNKVMVLFFNEQSPYLKKNEEALLIKILAAVHLRLENVDLVNLNNIRQLDHTDFMQEKTLHYLISFGISLTELKLQIHLLKYQIEKIEGITMLLADSLSFLEHDMDAKKQLWKCLKEMFVKQPS